MTESSEDGNYLVRVRAQVMSRDDSSGGWVPLEGGGLSNVSVRKRVRASPSTVCPPGGGGGGNQSDSSKPKHDYLIYGKRISDNLIVLSCTIKKDFEYNKVMPTFHHWKTGDKKFGLTFQAAADARAFDKGVRTAVEDLLDGYATTSPTTLLPKCPKDVGDDDVFMTLNLPQEPKDSRSSSDSSSKGVLGGVNAPQDHLHKITYIGRDKPLGGELIAPPPPLRQPSPYNKELRGGDNDQYVQLTAVPDYMYPTTEADSKGGLHRQDSSCSLKKCTLPPLPLKSKQAQYHQQFHLGVDEGVGGGLFQPQSQFQRKSPKMQLRCRHCHEFFTSDKNPKGACQDAPDLVRSAINRVSCVGCVQCVCYHCAADDEGDFDLPPCKCSLRDENCTKTWCCLAFLSILVPCLCLYPPLKLCHSCGIRCGICGGQHNADK